MVNASPTDLLVPGSMVDVSTTDLLVLGFVNEDFSIGLSVTNEGAKSASVKMSALYGEIPAGLKPIMIFTGTAARG